MIELLDEWINVLQINGCINHDMTLTLFSAILSVHMLFYFLFLSRFENQLHILHVLYVIKHFNTLQDLSKKIFHCSDRPSFFYLVIKCRSHTWSLHQIMTSHWQFFYLLRLLMGNEVFS